MGYGPDLPCAASSFLWQTKTLLARILIDAQEVKKKFIHGLRYCGQNVTCLATVGAGKTCIPRGCKKGVAGKGVIDHFIEFQFDAKGIPYHIHTDEDVELRPIRSVESSRAQATLQISLNRLSCKVDLFGTGTQIRYAEPHRTAIAK